jgi:hypothetical protein
VKSITKSAKGVSLARIREIWAKYNEEVFGAELSTPVFRITRARRYYGKFVSRESDGGRTFIFCVSGPLNRSDRNILNDTILHEMIHQWQHENGYLNNEHDETFYNWVPIIKEKTGITLDESWREDE